MTSPPSSIVCPDCGGSCGLLSSIPDEGVAAGAVIAYRCRDCQDRWDVVIEAEDLTSDADAEGASRHGHGEEAGSAGPA